MRTEYEIDQELTAAADEFGATAAIIYENVEDEDDADEKQFKAAMRIAATLSPEAMLAAAAGYLGAFFNYLYEDQEEV